MLVCIFFCTFRTRDRGCSAHPAFPAPYWGGTAPFFMGEGFRQQLGRIARRERGGVFESFVGVARRLYRRHPEEAATRPSRRTTARAAHPSRLAALAPQDDGSVKHPVSQLPRVAECERRQPPCVLVQNQRPRDRRFGALAAVLA